MPSRQVRVFSKWRQGPGGTMDPAVSEYNSENMQVYENGTLGVRPGWRALPQTNGTRVSAPSTDHIRSLVWARSTANAEFLLCLFTDTSDASNRKYDRFDLSTNTWASGASLLNTKLPNTLHAPEYQAGQKVDSWNDGLTLTAIGAYIAVADGTDEGNFAIPVIADDFVATVTSTTVFTVNDAAAMGLAVGDIIDIYQADGTSRATNRTVSALVGNTVTISVAAAGLAVGDLIMLDGSTINSPGYPAAVTIYRERAYYWGFSSNPGRVFYSEPADYKHVQTLSFFDVNNSADEAVGAVTGMWSVKNALVIGRADQRWMVLTGTSPENGTLRELGRDPVPDFPSGVIVNNELYYLNKAAVGVGIANPSAVDGKTLAHLSPLAFPGSTYARPHNPFSPEHGAGDETTEDFFLPGVVGTEDPIYSVERTNDVMVLSRWEPATVDSMFFTQGAPGEIYGIIDEGSTWQVYSRNYTLNRPAKTNDSRSRPLTNEDGTATAVVQLGETLAGEGKKIRPIKVVLDIDYWKGGQFVDPSISIDGLVLGTEAATPEDAIATQTVTTSSWANTVGDVPYKRRVSVALPNAQFGTRFIITLTVDNLALDSVQVYYDEQEDPR